MEFLKYPESLSKFSSVFSFLQCSGPPKSLCQGPDQLLNFSFPYFCLLLPTAKVSTESHAFSEAASEEVLSYE